MRRLPQFHADADGPGLRPRHDARTIVGMTPDALRRLALSLPEAREAPHHERTSFRVGEKIFATMTRDGREAMVKVADPDELEMLLAAHPEVFFSYGSWTTRLGALGVHLRTAPSALLGQLVRASWTSVAPQRARAPRATPRRKA